ncbi:hypothetical protein [Desulfomonile tiedjei]|uniref:Uncharacterized protein n=1 Tax=Desulfomonile tiedjei (strain ATCC 49306 / DSM 6799 / DCB-1) TaxID=706587 RepID=I4C8S5_DESTA|nr:hypothetical protein [Desulfomonile tiedjei]AFM25966.1 hypothetical protein Desti_3308 [Desulfomonile tiedjei DSM 6799]
MALRKRKTSTSEEFTELNGTGFEPLFDPELAERIRGFSLGDLTPSTALELIARLIGAVPASRKEGLEQIKLMDKLLNTARAMMETRLKNDEAAAIATRLDEMESWIKRLAEEKKGDSKKPREIWNGRMDS